MEPKEFHESEAARLLQSCPHGAVLVTHSLLFGVADIQATGAPTEGSRSIRDTIVSSKVRLHLCGHIHHAWGTSGVIAECPVHNLGPTVNWFAVW